jgi:AraC-like DNA-binding protein
VLTVLLSGASVLHERGHATLVEAGTALLARGDVAYRSAHPFGCGDAGCHVRPSPLLLETLRLPQSSRAMRLAPRAHLRFRLSLESVLRSRDGGLELEEASLALLVAATERRVRDDATAATRRHLALVEEAKALLLRRYAEPLTLSELARTLDASPFHLARLFRRHTGLSLHGYRTRVRLLSALERLADARGELARLALEVGFASQSHFTDAFRDAFGAPPGALAARMSRERESDRGAESKGPSAPRGAGGPSRVGESVTPSGSTPC